MPAPKASHFHKLLARAPLKSIAIAGLRPDLADPIEYRKSGLSLNHVIGCPLECAYCVRHLFDNYDMKQPRKLMEDSEAVERLINHRWFTPHVTPIQIFNRATDPLLPNVKPHLYRCLADLDARGLTNHVIVISRWRFTAADAEAFNSFTNIKVTLFFTWSGIEDTRLEPVSSAIAERSLAMAHAHARQYRTVFYWRPIIAGVNDTDAHLQEAKRISQLSHATVFSGLFYRGEIRDYLRSLGLDDAYPEIARRKVFPQVLEARIIEAMDGRPLFRKTSCGAAFAHAIPDFNGHYGIREICDICPVAQIAICAEAHRRPSQEEAHALGSAVGLDPSTVIVTESHILVRNSTEQQRYAMQHRLNFQVHDEVHPHHSRRHGRADVGWSAANA
ncbi:MAG: hypothetical protein ABL889_01910 [Terricaulis sp.]